MKKNKKILILIITIILLLSIANAIQIYAKYVTATNGVASMPISRWNILVNNTSIRNNSSISEQLTPVFPGNEFISAGILAPTAEGYLDINLDFSNVDVSFNYKITLATSQLSAISDFVATGYSIDNGPIAQFGAGAQEISNNVLLNEPRRQTSIRVYLKWDDDINTANMNNIEDTLATITPDAQALFDVTVSFIQIIQTN